MLISSADCSTAGFSVRARIIFTTLSDMPNATLSMPENMDICGDSAAPKRFSILSTLVSTRKESVSAGSRAAAGKRAARCSGVMDSSAGGASRAAVSAGGMVSGADTCPHTGSAPAASIKRVLVFIASSLYHSPHSGKAFSVSASLIFITWEEAGERFLLRKLFIIRSVIHCVK